MTDEIALPTLRASSSASSARFATIASASACRSRARSVPGVLPQSPVERRAGGLDRAVDVRLAGHRGAGERLARSPARSARAPRRTAGSAASPPMKSPYSRVATAIAPDDNAALVPPRRQAQLRFSVDRKAHPWLSSDLLCLVVLSTKSGKSDTLKGDTCAVLLDHRFSWRLAPSSRASAPRRRAPRRPRRRRAPPSSASSRTRPRVRPTRSSSPCSRDGRRPRTSLSSSRTAPPASSPAPSSAGLKADIVALSLAPDVDALVARTSSTPKWKKQSYKGMVTNSVVVFVLRNGNPKKIRTWNDLLRPDVEVVTPNPFTSGGARWNVMAAYGAWRKGGKTDKQAQAKLLKLSERRRPGHERPRVAEHVQQRQGRRPARVRERGVLRAHAGARPRSSSSRSRRS